MKDCAAVVTLGGATARALAGAGAKGALLDTNEDAAARIARDIGGIAAACDVSDGASTTLSKPQRRAVR